MIVSAYSLLFIPLLPLSKSVPLTSRRAERFRGVGNFFKFQIGMNIEYPMGTDFFWMFHFDWFLIFGEESGGDDGHGYCGPDHYVPPWS